MREDAKVDASDDRSEPVVHGPESRIVAAHLDPKPKPKAPHGMVCIRSKTVDGALVTIWRDGHHAFYVGKTPDANLDQYPMGAFRSVEAAQAWADRSFPGSEWRTQRAA